MPLPMRWRAKPPYPITTDEMVNTIASFEAVIHSIKSGATVKL